MYKAQISASHAIVHESPPIKSLGDVLNSNYMLHVSNGSSTAKAFLNDKENTILMPKVFDNHAGKKFDNVYLQTFHIYRALF